LVIYADILFAVNFSMDFISLFITGALCGRKIGKKSILISSAIGGLYGVFQVVCTLKLFLSVIINLTVSFLMCFISYYDSKIRRVIPTYIIFMGISAALAGFMSVLYSLLNSILYEYIKDYSYSGVYNGARFFVISSLAIIISLIFGRVFAEQKNIKSAQIEITLKKEYFRFNALCDSGNLLREPLSGKAVILVSDETRLGKAIVAVPDIYKRYIPYKAMNTGGIIKGVVPDEIKINGSKRDAIVASVNNKSFAGYDGCIPNSIV